MATGVKAVISKLNSVAGWRGEECRKIENAEGVRELSPGWRLGGALGTDNKKRAALKERKNRADAEQKKRALFWV